MKILIARVNRLIFERENDALIALLDTATVNAPKSATNTQHAMQGDKLNSA